jgi:predicted nuclease of predicted toxin-antitoxin system
VEQGLETLSDEDILEKAKIENRIILTVDLDFGNLLAIQKASFPSVILFRLGNQYYSLINERITLVLQNYSEILKTGAIVSITDQTIRVKKLPI